MRFLFRNWQSGVQYFELKSGPLLWRMEQCKGAVSPWPWSCCTVDVTKTALGLDKRKSTDSRMVVPSNDERIFTELSVDVPVRCDS